MGNFIFVTFVLIWATCLSATTMVVTTFDHDGDGVASGNGADTFISGQAPDSPGSSDAIKIRTQNSLAHIEVGYIRFDISRVARNSVNEARLRFYDFRFDEGAFTSGDTFAVFGLENQALDNWSETGITWNTAPGTTNDNVVNGHDFNGDAVFLGNFTFAYANPGVNGLSTEISIAGLANFINNDSNNLLTLMVAHVEDGGDSLHYLASREGNTLSRTNASPVTAGSLAPQLILDASPAVPEANSYLLLSLGVILGYGLFRNK